MPAPSNTALFTKSHKAAARRRAKRRDRVETVVFNEEARREFLTGFHKRKVEKANERKKKAAERVKLERLERRRQQRRSLAEQIAQNVAEVEKASGAIYNEPIGTEWRGMNPDRSQNGQEEEYENEEQLATVTVVEDFDLQALIQEPPRPPQHPSEDIDRIKHTTPSRQNDDTGRQKTKKRPKVRKIHYETKSARNAERKKQRARQKEKADRAGERRGKKPGIRKKGSK